MALAATIEHSQEASSSNQFPDSAPCLSPALFNIPSFETDALKGVVGKFEESLKARAELEKQAYIDGCRKDLSMLIRFLDHAEYLDQNRLAKVIAKGFPIPEVIKLIDSGIDRMTQEMGRLSNRVSGMDWPYTKTIGFAPTLSDNTGSPYADDKKVGIEVEAIAGFDVELHLKDLPTHVQSLIVTAFTLMEETFGAVLVGSTVFEANYWFEEVRTEIRDILKENPDVKDDEWGELLDEDEYGYYMSEGGIMEQVEYVRMEMSNDYEHLFKPKYNGVGSLDKANLILKEIWQNRHNSEYQHPYISIARQIVHYVRHFEKRGLSDAYSCTENIEEHGYIFEAFAVGVGLPGEFESLYDMRHHRMEVGENFSCLMPLDDHQAFSMTHERLKMFAIQMGIMLRTYEVNENNEQ